MSAAIYVRASQDREGRETSVTDQESVCRDLAARRGLDVVGVYSDNDRGASVRSRKTRPGYASLLEDARAGRFEVILAYSTSRLTRRPREFEDLIELAERHGTRIHTIRSGDPDFTTAQGRGIARTLSAWDAAQAEQTGENVATSIAGRLAKGQDIGGRGLFGWEVDRATVRESEAALDGLLARSDTRGAIALARQCVVERGGGFVGADLKAARGPWAEHWSSLDASARRRLVRALWRDVQLVPADGYAGRITLDGDRYRLGGPVLTTKVIT